MTSNEKLEEILRDFGSFGEDLSTGFDFAETIRRIDAVYKEERDIRYDRLWEAVIREDAAIQQTLGKALGYPRYCDDQVNFPGATEENGVFTGEHVAETIAHEAALKIEELQALCRHLQIQLSLERGKKTG